MENIKRILVINRMNPYSRKAFHIGVSIARKYDAKLMILHLVSDPVDLMVVNLPGLFPEVMYTNYWNSQNYAKEQLDKIIEQEKSDGFPIKELIADRDTVEEIVKVAGEEQIDLIIMLAHQEGRIEHALFGGDNDAIIRRMPCSILLVKEEPGSANE